MARYLGWLANTVLFVLCCFFAAETVNAVIGSTLVAAQGPRAAAVADADGDRAGVGAIGR